MRVVIIGAGNVATVFGRLIAKANHEIIQVVSRKIASAQLLAKELGCAFSNDPKILDTTADVYIVAMADAALNEIHEDYFLGDKLIVHTAGSLSKDILKMVSINYGVIYPLQSLRKENLELHQDIPLLIDGNSADILAIIEKFAFTLSSTVAETNDEQRLKLHVAAVIVSNFTNHLYALAADYCSKESLDFKMLQPLIEETALRLRYHLPREMQTGPAIRKDIMTLDKHLRVLSHHPELKKVYLRITDSIMNASPGP
ncbi:MAG: DUF2520 domain-containing protein [Ferruginibacter sp.]|nr:DUF2520 domain-containing protein [Ferruginibacter sp.]